MDDPTVRTSSESLREFLFRKAEHSQKSTLFFSGSYLYHYTGVQGLQGICENGTLFATDARYLSDRSELKHGKDFILEQLRSVPHSAPHGDLCRMAAEMWQEQPPQNVFIASFSTREDALSLWRSYSDVRNAYCLQFGQSFLRQRLAATGSILRTLYAADEKKSFIEWLLQQISAYFQINSEGLTADIPGAAKAIIEFTEAILPMFKNESFQDEAEVRAVLPRHCGPVKFRAGKRFLVPYVEIKLWDEGHPDAWLLEQITVGPASELDQRSSIASLGLYLETLGLVKSGRILQSKVPFEAI